MFREPVEKLGLVVGTIVDVAGKGNSSKGGDNGSTEGHFLCVYLITC